MPWKYDVFVSYSSMDWERVHPIVDYLEKQCHLRVWVDRKRVDAGDRWLEMVKEALQSSRVILLFISENYLAPDSVWTIFELGHAVANGRNQKVVPVVFDGDKKHIPDVLGHIQAVGLASPHSWEELRQACEPEPGRVPTGYLEKLRRSNERLRIYRNLPPGIRPMLMDVFEPPRASQVREEEEEDRLQEVLRMLGRLELSKPRKVELQVVAPATELLRQCPYVLIIGDAGTGKTTLLQWIVLENAAAILDGGSGGGFLQLTGPLIPLEVLLEPFAFFLGRVQAIQGHAKFLKYLEEMLHEDGLDKEYDLLTKALRAGRCIVLFDGLDEIGGEAQRRLVCQTITECRAEFPSNRYVITSRRLPISWFDQLGSDIKKATLTPLNDDQIAKVVHRWAEVLRDESPGLEQRVTEEITSHARIADLCRNPLVLSLVILSAITTEGVVSNRLALLERCITAFLEYSKKAVEHGAQKKIRGCIGFVAMKMHHCGKRETPWQTLLKWVIHYFDKVNPLTQGEGRRVADAVLDTWTQQPGILHQIREDRFSFVHLSFQEYLAAWEIAKTANPFKAIRNRLEDDFWRGAVLFIAQILARDAKQEGTQFISKIAAVSSNRTSSHHICLAAQCLVEADMRAGELADSVRRGLLLAIGDDRRGNLERIECGTVLGLLGDPRITDTEPEMVFVPGGEFSMGSDEAEIEPILRMAAERRFEGLDVEVDFTEEAWEVIRKLYRRETPRHRAFVRSFRLSKYQITHAQYRAFVSETGHWAPGGKADWAEPYAWRNGTFPAGLANHPVVLVAYEDALSYCEWLRKKTHKPYRLPTEAEWERAARGTDGRTYPWGSDWHPEYCNTLSSRLRQTVPVGVFPKGASPEGVMDMIGNVWEWCSTIWGSAWDKPEFSYPYSAQDGRENETRGKGTKRVVRGGSWSTDATRARCAYRTIDVPGTRNLLSVGFRVALDVTKDA